MPASSIASEDLTASAPAPAPASTAKANTLLTDAERKQLEDETREVIVARTRALVEYWRQRGDAGEMVSAECVEQAGRMVSSIKIWTTVTSRCFAC